MGETEYHAAKSFSIQREGIITLCSESMCLCTNIVH